MGPHLRIEPVFSMEFAIVAEKSFYSFSSTAVRICKRKTSDRMRDERRINISGIKRHFARASVGDLKRVRVFNEDVV